MFSVVVQGLESLCRKTLMALTKYRKAEPQTPLIKKGDDISIATFTFHEKSLEFAAEFQLYYYINQVMGYARY